VSWTPQFAAVFDEPIINNALAVIERDFKAGLDYFYQTENLADFEERALGQIEGNGYPSLAIGPAQNDTDQSDDDSDIAEVARVVIYIGVTDDGPSTVTRKIMKYVRVMDAVLRTAKNDFFTGMSNPHEVHLKLVHSYDSLRGEKPSYFRAAVIELTVYLRER
jgi:hypothetical protein